jgi:glucosyl-3-phosphoglycerate synthase
MELGKGRNVWYCMGYAIASGRSDVVALHDCDILTYSATCSRASSIRWANPRFGYVFSKGYYSRIADGKLNGRVSRLLVGPLLEALARTVGHQDYISYLAAFRYPLSGEFAMRMSTITRISASRPIGDWRSACFQKCGEAPVRVRSVRLISPTSTTTSTGPLRR